MRFLGKILIVIIKAYQQTISPILMPACRYQPTCSQYGIDSLKKHGLVNGCKLMLKRIITCHPWGGHGYDPVP